MGEKYSKMFSGLIYCQTCYPAILSGNQPENRCEFTVFAPGVNFQMYYGPPNVSQKNPGYLLIIPSCTYKNPTLAYFCSWDVEYPNFVNSINSLIRYGDGKPTVLRQFSWILFIIPYTDSGSTGSRVSIRSLDLFHNPLFDHQKLPRNTGLPRLG